MRIHDSTTILLALLAARACAGVLAASASAGTGGATGDASAHGLRRTDSQRRPTKIHKTGIATWFGPGFYGQQTACGQTLTPGGRRRRQPHAARAARSSRSPTAATRLTVPVIDRGPYANDADWDLTAGAAQALGDRPKRSASPPASSAACRTPRRSARRR